MKLKRQPEDFRVEELPLVEGGDFGRFAFYRLTKRGVGTLEALEEIRRRWNLSARQVSYGGLKDRHAVTIQYLTILDGPDRGFRERGLDLEPLGRLPRPYGPDQFRGNRFTVVLRDLSAAKAEAARVALDQLPRDGLPNYFDDQRFGSVGFGGDFIGRAWLVGEHEEALRLAIAEPNPNDRPDARDEKAILRDCWGNWAEAKGRLPRSHARSLVTYLVDHPTDFRGAFARVRRELRSLYFSAFQSHLWNLQLARLIERTTHPDQRELVEFKVASLPIHRGLDPDQAALLSSAKLPLPASRTPLPDEGPVRDAVLEVVAGFGLTWEQLRVKHLKDVYFSKGVRPALFFAEGLTQEAQPDDLYPGRVKIALGFELPKGAYATLVVKRVTDAAPAAGADRGGD
jgi:tRNA pseudouridine13 synthase